MRYPTERAQFAAVYAAYLRAMTELGWGPPSAVADFAFFAAAESLFEQPWRIGIPNNNPAGYQGRGDLGYWSHNGQRYGAFSSLIAFARAALRGTWAAELRRMGGFNAAIANPRATQRLVNWWVHGRAADTRDNSTTRNVDAVVARMQRVYRVSRRAGDVILGQTDRRTGAVTVNYTGDARLDLETVVHEAYHAGGARYSYQEGPGEEQAAEQIGKTLVAQWWGRYGS